MAGDGLAQTHDPGDAQWRIADCQRTDWQSASVCVKQNVDYRGQRKRWLKPAAT